MIKEWGASRQQLADSLSSLDQQRLSQAQERHLQAGFESQPSSADGGAVFTALSKSFCEAAFSEA